MIGSKNFPAYLNRDDTDIEEVMNSVDEKFIAEYGRRHPLFFAKYIVGFKEVHMERHKSIEDLLLSPRMRKMYLVPRSSFKTSIISISDPIRELTIDPDLRFLIDSENSLNSVDIVKQIGRTIETKSVLFSLYGIEPGDEWSDKKKSIKKKSIKKEATFSVSGVTSEKTSQHYDRIKQDDLVARRNIKTVAQRNKVREHYRYNLSLLDPFGVYEVIGTRWAMYDLYGWIEENFKGDGIEDYLILMEKAIREDGSLYFPERLSKEFLAKKLQEQGKYIFSCQYQNTPVSRENQELHFENFIVEPELPKYMRNVLIQSVDPASEDENKEEKNDYSCSGIIAADENGEPWIIDIKMTRGNETVVADMAIDMIKKWKPMRLIFENNSFQKVYKNIIKWKINKDGLSTKIIPVIAGPHLSKSEKIRKLVPFDETRRIHILKTIVEDEEYQEVRDELQNEMTYFPKAMHDDILDMIQQALDHTITPVKPVPVKEHPFAGIMKRAGLNPEKHLRAIKKEMRRRGVA